MKLKFSFKNKEASLEADVEKLVEKSMDIKSTKPDRKTWYQIRQEEKRKTFILKQEEKRKEEEAKNKQVWIGLGILFGFAIVMFVFGMIATYLGI